MRVVSLHNPMAIEDFLRRDAELHLYELGDLDPFFWPLTTWYGLEDGGALAAVLLLYHAFEVPTLMALGRPPADALRHLLRTAVRLLPPRLYAHLSPGGRDELAPAYEVRSHGRFLKMALHDPSRLAAVDTASVVALAAGDREELEAMYRASYPGNWFDPRMLETGRYYGVRQGGELVSVAGVHVYAPARRVAVLGNVATHPGYRARGYARAVTARLCRELLAEADLVGLNVRADNAAAVACYERLGFEPVAEYEECSLSRRPEEGKGAVE